MLSTANEGLAIGQKRKGIPDRYERFVSDADVDALVEIGRELGPRDVLFLFVNFVGECALDRWCVFV